MLKKWAILLLAICAIACNVVAEDDWWEYGHFYQIYPRSFQDSDGDGLGDINGITARLDYLKTIGVTGTWLSPIFKSPMKDFGYDISDFQAIQPEYGTMEDFERLVARAKELDIKLVLDFVPNHCSDQHEWFKKALNKSDPDHDKYKDYFIWHGGKLLENGTRVPPSNWLSIFRGSAWKWVDEFQQYYLHQFLEEQPDLNFRNQELVDEMKEVLRFWLRKGVDGFRIDAVPFIFESKENADGYYTDEPKSGICDDDPEASCSLNHTETKDLDETYDMIYQWRQVVDEEEFSNNTKVLMTEGYTDLPLVMRYFGEIKDGAIVNGKYGAQIPFNFLLLTNTWSGTGTWGYKFQIDDFINALPKGDKIQANWVLGNHDNGRIASKYKPTRIDLYNILLKTLPGIAVTYYGEEIGMTNVFISWEETVDPQACRTDPDRYIYFSRDPERTPFQWDFSKNSGFSTASKTWLPVAKNYTLCNVALQNRLKRSHLNVFRQVMELRQNPTMKYGALKLSIVDDELFVYQRVIEDQPDADIIVVVLNLFTNKKTVDLNQHLDNLPRNLTIVTASVHARGNILPIVPGNVVDSSKVIVSSEAAIVFIGNNN